MDGQWDHSYDVVVIGSGAAGLTAALTARLRGLSVLVLEKTDKFGGTTSLSGGAIWIPGNLYLEHAGIGDTPQKARAYLDATVGDRVPADRRAAYLRRGPEMVRFLHENTRYMRFEYTPGYSDYYPERPGGFGAGRSCEPSLFDLRLLGPHRARMRRAELPTYGMVMNSREFHHVNMITRTWVAAGRLPGSAPGWSGRWRRGPGTPRWARHWSAGCAHRWRTSRARSGWTRHSVTWSSRTGASPVYGLWSTSARW